MTTIWIVWARRGEYADRTEYPVCWCATEAEADAEAERLTELSGQWRDRVRAASGDWDGRSGSPGIGEDEQIEAAKAALGDPSWSGRDETEYWAISLERRTT